ncbi:FAD-dependent oxidoreductase [Chloroflexota bacterium]
MKLFEPGRIGNLALKNRIVMAPMFCMGMMSPSVQKGYSQRGVDYYTARAKGGTGLIITGVISPNEKMEASWGFPLVSDIIASLWLNELAESVHDYGAKVAVQFSAGFGRQGRPDPRLPHGGLVAPSPMPSFHDPSIMCRELTTEEIEEFVEDFEYGASVIKNAEIDAIEIHAHQGYLLDQFITARTNQRTDKYGGSLDNRLRIIEELFQAVKRGAGAEYPVTFRYGLTHHSELEGSRTDEEGLEIARRMEAVGFDALHIDAGFYETNNWAQPPTTQPPGCLLYLAEMTKQAVKIPVIAVGKLGYPDLAERVLQEGKAEFVALGRHLLADPEWPNKVREGRLEDIKPCLGDHEGCLARVGARKYISCTVNPQTGNERNLALTPAEKQKNVVVVGGGPGGMEAARVAAERGHRVTLLEKDYELGGNVIAAAVPDFKLDYRRLIDYLATQLRKLGVSTRLGTRATPELIKSLKPDVVFIATGSSPIAWEVSEACKGKVFTAVDLLLNRPEIGDSVVIIGGGFVGAETALYLGQQGKSVTVIEMFDKIMRDCLWINALDIQRRFDGLESDRINVKVLTETKAEEITAEGVVVVDKTGKRSTLKADTVVLAVGMKSNEEGLAEALQGKVAEIYSIGDCVKPGKVKDAMWGGFRTARLI